MWNGQMGWGGMGILWVILALIVIAGVLTIYQGVREARRQRQDTPEQVIKRRYAKGEIDRDTYQRMLDDLRK